ncbi:hypothetical protein [Paraburkholderia antibiotica]|uniref:Uncharacterized protein n=1 Tax=Paraburkholderia antibiotica TaxID=2728839 RepID=A0A7X9X446_9BURK|nr:hypothetical protein [Paraburkholderia antibiotica]NML31051.1 hypothetical protein [Paraburkholderia antibiotica]
MEVSLMARSARIDGSGAPIRARRHPEGDGALVDEAFLDVYDELSRDLMRDIPQSL